MLIMPYAFDIIKCRAQSLVKVIDCFRALSSFKFKRIAAFSRIKPEIRPSWHLSSLIGFATFYDVVLIERKISSKRRSRRKKAHPSNLMIIEGRVIEPVVES